MSDNNNTINDLKKVAHAFATERDWQQFYGAKNLSTAIAVEAAELMELFMWARDQQEAHEVVANKRPAVENELADVLFGVLLFADEYNIDLSDAFKHKMEQNAKKYSVERCKGMNKKYDEY
jgi:dCTP diphosphatase